MPKDGEQLFKYVLALSNSYFEDYLFSSLLIGFVKFFYTYANDSLYILETIPMFDV